MLVKVDNEFTPINLTITFESQRELNILLYAIVVAGSGFEEASQTLFPLKKALQAKGAKEI